MWIFERFGEFLPDDSIHFLQEIATKELNNSREQKQKLEAEIIDLEYRSEKLHGLYDEQENLLNEIFGFKCACRD